MLGCMCLRAACLVPQLAFHVNKNLGWDCSVERRESRFPDMIAGPPASVHKAQRSHPAKPWHPVRNASAEADDVVTVHCTARKAVPESPGCLSLWPCRVVLAEDCALDYCSGTVFLLQEWRACCWIVRLTSKTKAEEPIAFQDRTTHTTGLGRGTPTQEPEAASENKWSCSEAAEQYCMKKPVASAFVQRLSQPGLNSLEKFSCMAAMQVRY